MPFLGCDVDTLRAWSVAARRDAQTLGERLAALRSALASVDWVGPDRDAFDAAFSSRVERACGTAAAQLMEISTEAAHEADQQDRASGAGADGRGGQGDGDASSPGETDQSGPPVPVPDDVRQQIDDPATIVQKAIDIKQGSMGDCFFLASLAATAQSNPEFIERNIWFSDGKYHVRLYDTDFFGGTHESVVDVDPQVASKGVRDKDDEISWVSVYEAAYAQHRGGYDDIEGGGFAQDAMPTITGRPTRTADDEPSFDDLRSEFERGNVVVADTAPRGGDDGGWWDIINNDDGPVPRDTVSRHQYVVRGFTEDGRIIMQNPWGPDGGYEKDDDVFKPGQLVLTESEYRERFENVTITEDPDTSNPAQPVVVP